MCILLVPSHYCVCVDSLARIIISCSLGWRLAAGCCEMLAREARVDWWRGEGRVGDLLTPFNDLDIRERKKIVLPHIVWTMNKLLGNR